ncbi:MAG TPA: hypothetical protein VMU94_18205, partial [Streptosporangiaceae bacterium]|nr:hypothetical protein [Streptosporangiaceae bacterium]
MPVLDLQRRAYQSGRIRLGKVVKTGKQDKAGKDITRPVKLDTFRFTSPSRFQVDAAAEAYDGEVRPWDNRGRKEWEVVTKVDEIMVAIPPAADAISQWYEMWTGGGCKRRCDSQREQKSDGPCLCPHASDPKDEDEVDRMARERARLSKLMPPQACGLKTRVNVVLPDLPDIGVWRLDTGGFYAAGELVGKAELMRLCRDRDLFLPARLWIDQRVDVVDGQTRKYPVPALEIQKTFRQVATGELEAGGWAAQLPAASGEQPKAITAAPAQPSDVPRPEPELASGSSVASAGPGHSEPLDEEALYQVAQGIADRLAVAQTAAEFKALGKEMDDAGCGEIFVCVDRQNDTHEQLRDFGLRLWDEKARG